ncbi:MAG: leucine-rich repeat protein [Ruminococcus sp.]|nr:leucine-rich repeat protein [Ruminococcus sp.]
MKKKFSMAVIMLALCLANNTARSIPYEYLHPITVSASATENPGFDIQDGVLVSYNGTDSEVKVPDGITKIGNSAFYGKQVQSVSLPDTVTEIGSSAFANSALRDISLPEGLRSIGRSAFQNTWLTEVHIPHGVTEIPDDAFFNSRLTKVTIPDSVTKIGNMAFCNTALADIEIPDSVTFAANNAFMGTPYLKTLVSQNGGWLILSNGLLVSYVGNDVNAVMPETVRCIGTKSFLNRTRMQTLTIPDSVKSIESTPFVNCKPEIIYSTNPIAEKLSIACISAPEIPPSDSQPALDLSSDTWQLANEQAVFGDTYCLTDAARSQLAEQIKEKYQTFDSAWNGSCYGIVLTTLLVKYGLLSPSDIQEDAASLNETAPDKNALSVINYYQFMQYSEPALQIAMHSGISDTDFFEQIIKLGWQAEQQGKPFLLSFNTGSGGHTCAGCGIESGEWEWDGKSYNRRIILWDPNYPTEYREDVCIYYREADYDFCIPHYGVRYTYGGSDNVGELTAASDEVNVLGSPAYPFRSCIKGDVNADGSVDAADIAMLRNWLVRAADAALTEPQAGDMNADGNSDVFDLILMRKALITQ